MVLIGIDSVIPEDFLLRRIKNGVNLWYFKKYAEINAEKVSLSTNPKRVSSQVIP